MNSLPIANFRFSNVVLRKEKSKKCSPNLDLNPTCVGVKATHMATIFIPILFNMKSSRRCRQVRTVPYFYVSTYSSIFIQWDTPSRQYICLNPVINLD